MAEASDGELQFESVVPPPIPGREAVEAGVTCVTCHRLIGDAYYDVNGQSVCGPCRDRLLTHVQTPQGWAVFLRASAFGVAAAIAGAILYYAVIAITDLEIGLVAIAIGYMVGYGVRMGTNGRGGRRFQILAVVLTYLSVSLAYTILAFRAASDDPSGPTATAADVAGSGTPTSGAASDRERREARDSGNEASEAAASREGGSVLGLAFLIGFCLVLPFIVVFSSLPSGLISAAIIVFGMLQAWRLTMAPLLSVSGPFRVGVSAAPSRS